jgi:uncharacterized glyoxalase superfamily metalloenzyme YdcJ
MSPLPVSADEVRSRFSAAMSDMYRQEVPLYGTLLDLVAEVNARTRAADDTAEDLAHDPDHDSADAARIEVERHGAIRLGTAQELATMRRVLAVMGLHPVGYYDLCVAGVPVHSTAFRPIERDALHRNPFRLFTSLLRLELLDDADLRAQAEALLARRAIFSPRLLELTAVHEKRGGLSSLEADEFVLQATATFRWHGESPVPASLYEALHARHPLIADVVCFKGPHINHLTPRTLDIDQAQAAMIARGIDAKDVIEGPPRRRCPILLRQTSFKALEESIVFAGGTGPAAGTHTARFGEIEERGVALTREGRALYDRLLAQALSDAAITGDHAAAMARAFAAFPDDAQTLRRERLAFFRYVLTGAARAEPALDGEASIESLIARGLVRAEPITYEDFLPVSAAGIFQSNLRGANRADYAAGAARASFEHALGCAVLDEIALYESEQRQSLRDVRAALGAAEIA